MFGRISGIFVVNPELSHGLRGEFAGSQVHEVDSRLGSQTATDTILGLEMGKGKPRLQPLWGGSPF